MPGRAYFSSSGAYKYGFNGKENDDEVKGSGNSLDFGARIYDSRLGRFLSVDPDVEMYPFMSPYCYAANSPIKLIDEEGRGPKPPQTPRGRPLQRTANWLQVALEIQRSNFKNSPKPKTSTGRPQGGAYQIFTNADTYSGENSSRYPTRGVVEGLGSYNAQEAMILVGKALENSKEYFEKTKQVAPADYNENTGANYSAIVVTEVYVKIPGEVQKLEASYQTSIKESSHGKLSDAEFNKLPIQEQNTRYNSAKLINGVSPKDKYIELAKKEYNSGSSNSSANTGSSTTSGSSMTTGTSGSSPEIKAATTYR